MRYFIFALSVALIISGCKKSSNPVESVTNTALSVSQVRDSMQFTLVIPKTVFGIHDTLSMSFTVYNQSAEPETLMISIGEFQWLLKNDSGRTVMREPGPLANPRSFPIVFNPHQSKEIFGVNQAITDTSGAQALAGSYTLQGLYDLMIFTLDLSLQ